MNNIKFTEHLNTELLTLGAENSENDKSITDFKEIYLSTDESKRIFQIWYSKFWVFSFTLSSFAPFLK